MYLDDVEPVLRAGMDFLRDEGRAVGCYANRYMRVIDSTMGPAARLRLYHEVTVAAVEDQLFEYLGCHPGTGLLRVLPVKAAGPGGGPAFRGLIECPNDH